MPEDLFEWLCSARAVCVRACGCTQVLKRVSVDCADVVRTLVVNEVGTDWRCFTRSLRKAPQENQFRDKSHAKLMLVCPGERLEANTCEHKRPRASCLKRRRRPDRISKAVPTLTQRSLRKMSPIISTPPDYGSVTSNRLFCNPCVSSWNLCSHLRYNVPTVNFPQIHIWS